MLPQILSRTLVGLRLTIFKALNSRSLAWHCGPSCERGRKTLCTGLLWTLQTASPVMPQTSCKWSGQLWLLWVVWRPSVAVSGGSHVLADTYGKNLGSWYSHKLLEYPVFDLRLLKRCLQKVSYSVFGSLDRFWLTEFFVTRLKGWCHVPVFVVPSLQESCRCRRFLRLTATSWESGPSSWYTLRRLADRLTATA